MPLALYSADGSGLFIHMHSSCVAPNYVTFLLKSNDSHGNQKAISEWMVIQNGIIKEHIRKFDLLFFEKWQNLPEKGI